MKDCNQCGKCCLKYGGGDLDATQEEIDLWELFNPEIFKFVSNNQIWFNPESGAKLETCPFLEVIPSKSTPNKILPYEETPKNIAHSPVKYSCSIYFDRPEDCRLYPSLVAEMIRDECEMIEAVDLLKPKQAQRSLALLMNNSG